MAEKLYIGNLPFNVTQSQIQELFSQAGVIHDVYIARNRYTSKSSGFGFVEMESEAAARKAIQLFHGYLLSERPMTVQMVQKPTSSEFKGAAGTTVYKKLPHADPKEAEKDDGHD